MNCLLVNLVLTQSSWFISTVIIMLLRACESRDRLSYLIKHGGNGGKLTVATVANIWIQISCFTATPLSTSRRLAGWDIKQREQPEHIICIAQFLFSLLAFSPLSPSSFFSLLSPLPPLPPYLPFLSKAKNQGTHVSDFWLTDWRIDGLTDWRIDGLMDWRISALLSIYPSSSSAISSNCITTQILFRISSVSIR